MCGFAGFFDKHSPLSSPEVLLETMGTAIAHRGPDSSGILYDSQNHIGYSHRRLSILDLSERGHQPMTSDQGHVLIYNGEIYNFNELKISLQNQNIQFHSESDTEVLFQALTHWGIEKTLKQINGMFAFVFFDASKKKLLLARDRIGIKPLFYGITHNRFVFGSDLTSLKNFPSFEKKISHQALSYYFKFNYIPHPHTIYENIFKLPPGHYLEIDTNKNQIEYETASYWSPYSPLELSSNYQSDLENLLLDSVKLRLISDVPIGCFLSGGIDSSLISALAQSISKNPINTFTIGFDQKDYDESKQASRIAKHLGSHHHETILSSQALVDIIPKLSQYYSEPFADSSQIPSSLIAQVASQKVKVILSGDGGDELFWGYNRYQWSQKIWNLKRNPVKCFLGKSIPLDFMKLLIKTMMKQKNSQNVTSNILKLKSLLRLKDDSFFSFYEQVVSNITPDFLADDSLATTHLFDDQTVIHRKEMKSSEYPQMLMSQLDLATYLPGDILEKVDKATMGHSLEARVPLLDHRIINFAQGLPREYKIQGHQTKIILKNILKKYIPEHLTNQPKSGFSVPIANWIAGPLNEWVSDLLSSEQLNQHHLFETSKVQRILKEHNTGKQNHQQTLWALVMFQSWYNNYQ
ncbi:MAG: asparagine synthase (glutamine-hydrolyzing) [Halobacteriovoraceae bacterium]|nr:asparagine synthase (glutamine-hydrolyzing) [Halobacteriovoraceae bacterium]